MPTFDPATYQFVNQQLRAGLTDDFEYQQALQLRQQALAQAMAELEGNSDAESLSLARALREASMRSQMEMAQAQLGVSEAGQRGALDITQGQRGFDTGLWGAGVARDQQLRDLELARTEAFDTFSTPFIQRGVQNGGIPIMMRQRFDASYGNATGDVATGYEDARRQLTDRMTGVTENAALGNSIAGGRAGLAASQASTQQSMASQAAQEGFELAQKEIKRRQGAQQKNFDIWRDQALGSNKFRAGMRDQQASEFFTTQGMAGLDNAYG